MYFEKEKKKCVYFWQVNPKSLPEILGNNCMDNIKTVFVLLNLWPVLIMGMENVTEAGEECWFLAFLLCFYAITPT